MITKNKRYDLKYKQKRFLEISFIIALGLLIMVFKIDFPKDNKDEYVIGTIIFDHNDFIVCGFPSTPSPPLRKCVIAIVDTTDEDIEDIEIDDTELNPDDEITSPPPIFIEN